MNERVDYALVGLTLAELAAVRDAVAREVDARRQAHTKIPAPLRDGLRKLTYYHDRRKEGHS